MPAGLAKVLELLGNSLDVSDPKGTLEVNATRLVLKEGKAQLIATYKDGNGLLAPEKLAISGTGITPEDFKVSGDSKVIDLTQAGTYTVTADSRTVEIKVAEPA